MSEISTDWRNRNQGSFLTEFDATYDRTRVWLAEVMSMDDSRVLFMVDDLAGQSFGVHGLAQIDWDLGCGEADAIVRGRDEPRGAMGLALKALIGWATRYLGLDPIHVRVRSDNPALAFYERLGFQEEQRVPLRLLETPGMKTWVPDAAADPLLTLVHMKFSPEASK